LGNGWPIDGLLDRYSACRFHGLNLSMLQDITEWNPFDVLLERDSSREARPDLVFLTEQALVPVVGVVLVHKQKEYSAKVLHEEANTAIEQLLAQREAAMVSIDTRLDLNTTGLRTAAEVESLIAKMDLVVTTRLHGLVLALKHGIPALAIDPVAGGAKICRQAEVIGWPMVIKAEQISNTALNEAFDYCLSDGAKQKARKCHAQAVRQMSSFDETFIAALRCRNAS
ncbi:MAG: polysaccharide pyruvyl transferase family protein, partial [Pseudomonadales bacterium]